MKRAAGEPQVDAQAQAHTEAGACKPPARAAVRPTARHRGRPAGRMHADHAHRLPHAAQVPGAHETVNRLMCLAWLFEHICGTVLLATARSSQPADLVFPLPRQARGM